MCFPDSIVGVNVDENKSVIRFVEMAIRMNKPKLDSLAPQSAQKNINLEDLKPLLIAIPEDLEEQLLIAERYEQIFKLINTNKVLVKKLHSQKQGLMQDLLTGKKSVDSLPDNIVTPNSPAKTITT